MQLFMPLATILLYFSGQLLAMEQPDIKNGVEVFFANNKKSTLSYKKLADLSQISMTIRYMLKDFDDEHKPELHLPSINQNTLNLLLEHKDLITKPHAHYELCTQFEDKDLYDMETLANIIYAADYLDIEPIKLAALSSLTTFIRSSNPITQKNKTIKSLEKAIAILHPDQQKEIFSSVINKNHQELLLESCQSGLLSLAKLLVIHYIKPTMNLCKHNQQEAQKNLESALKNAVENKQAPIAHMLLDNMANPDSNNVLFDAIKNHDYDMIKLLLKHGANPNLNTNDDTPLSIAYKANAPKKIVALLKEHNAVIPSDWLISFIKKDDLSAIEVLIKKITPSIEICIEGVLVTLKRYEEEGNKKMGGIKFDTRIISHVIDYIHATDENFTHTQLAIEVVGAALRYKNKYLLEKALLMDPTILNKPHKYGECIEIYNLFSKDTYIWEHTALEAAILKHDFMLIAPILAYGGYVRKKYCSKLTDIIDSSCNYQKQKKSELIKLIEITALP